MANTLIELLKGEAKEVVREFKKASLTGSGTPQEVADFREGYFKYFLERYFPFPHRITKGTIIDSFGHKSDSIDCVVCNPIHPYTLDKTGKFSLIFADGVDFAIEIKPNLQIKSELEIALNQSRSVKKLRRAQETIPNFGNSVQLIEFTKTVPSIVFSLKAKSDIDDTVKEIVTHYINTQTPVEEQFDLIVINNLGILLHQKFQNQYRKINYGYHFEAWGDLTIAAFLLYLDVIPHASLRMSKGIFQRYLERMSPNVIKSFSYLTDKLFEYK